MGPREVPVGPSGRAGTVEPPVGQGGCASALGPGCHLYVDICLFIFIEICAFLLRDYVVYKPFVYMYV